MGLFNGRNVNVTFEDVWFSDCKLSSASNVSGLIQTERCFSASLGFSIRLFRVQFKMNTNTGGSAGLHIEDPSCSDIVMNDVAFMNNTSLNGSCLSSQNSLENIRLVGNEVLFINNGVSILNFPSVLYFPPRSKTLILVLFAWDNNHCLLVEEGELSVYNATFVRTRGSDFRFPRSKMPASIGAKKANVTIFGALFSRNHRAIRLDEECNFMAVGSLFSRNGLNNMVGSAIFAIRPQSIRLVSTVFEKNTFSYNPRGANEGTVYVRGSSGVINSSLIDVSHCQFRENRAYNGGGFRIADFHRGRILVNSTTFSGNGWEGGAWHEINPAGYGGVFYIKDCNEVSFRIQRSIFDSNRASSSAEQDSGGAIYVQNITGELRIHRSRFHDNIATDSGGAISVKQPEVTLLTVNVSDCYFMRNRCFFLASIVPSFGGSISVIGNGVELDIRRTIFRNNSADSGGSIYAEYIRLLRMERCTFHSNFASLLGGAMMTVDCEPSELRRSRLVNNTAQHGGAIYSGSEEISMYNCVFARNKASGNGGALATVTTSATILCHSCRFYSNSAKKNGGAIHVFPAKFLSLNDVVFMKNKASFWGGAVSILLTEVFNTWSISSISQCNFSENQAALGGK